MTYEETLADLYYCLDSSITTIIQQHDSVYGTEYTFRCASYCEDCSHYKQKHRWCNHNSGCTNRLLKDIKQTHPEFFI